MSEPSAPNDLAARLRDLRGRHPGLSVTTELLRLDETLAAFRATVAIDEVPRASGHAACPAERSGAFVAAAEAAAVAQALLLGGFAATETAVPAAATAETGTPPTVVPLAPPADPVTADRDTRRPTRIMPAADAATPGPVALSAPSRRPAPRSRAGTDQANSVGSVPVPPDPPVPVPPEPQERRPTAAHTEAEGGISHSPRETRARSHRRQPQADAVPAPARGDEADAIHPPAPVSRVVAAATATIMPPRHTRRTAVVAPDRAQPTGGMDGAVPPAPESAAPLTLERLQEAWRPGQPIPAWWPAGREPNLKPASRQQRARIFALGLAAEMTAQQVERYCQLLFHRGLPDLAHWQATVLLARLDPRFPNPLGEVRVGRILHPLAVGDFVPVADGQDGFIRWGDLPAAAAVG